MNGSKYGLRGEFGDVFVTGTLSEINKIKQAMVDYGVLERKLHIVEPEHADFKLSKELKEEMISYCSDEYAEANNFSSIRELEEHRLAEDYTDHDLFEWYCGQICDEELDETYVKAKSELDSYKAEKVLLEE